MRRIALAVALVLATAACGGGKKEAATTTTSVVETTTTTMLSQLPPGGAPLTGLVADAAKTARPLLIVKIDNAPKARPQAGLNQADVVVEEAVEGGVTRFVTMFHSQDADPVGPVRSARSTDMLLAAPLNRPLFAYSGANAGFDKLIRESPVVDVGYEAQTAQYTRERGRPALYNVFSATPRLHGLAPAGSGPPPPLFWYRHPGQPSVGDAMGGVRMEYRGKIVTAVQWAWDAGVGLWKRSQDGGPHVDAAGAPVTAHNVVVQLVTYHDTGYRDQSGAEVPEADLVGEGEAWVLSDGKVVKGRWKRGAAGEVTQYLDGAGQPIRLTPGRTWVELPIPGNATLG
ncbi:MAG TPA: DUF3048 domain-containing protein [Acidimicrobiales bacterium]|nr:DUF3048 domain-containing protein [Acidimicrobiales bacterium]